MLDVNRCYKIAFDALFETRSLERMAEKVSEFIGASVMIVKADGEVSLYSSAAKNKTRKKTGKKYITTKMFDTVLKLRQKEKPDCFRFNRWCSAVYKKIEIEEQLYGYSVVIFRSADPDAEKEYLSVAEIMSTIIANYWKTEENCRREAVPVRKRLIVHDIFCGNSSDLIYLAHEIEDGYMIAYFPQNTDIELQQEISRIWEQTYERTDHLGTWVFFYRISKEEDRKQIINRLGGIQKKCCVSSLFSELIKCPQKIKWLKRLYHLMGFGGTGNVIQEGEWRAEAVYSCAYQALEAAGVRDYALQILQDEDAEKNTDFYETLKCYFLCGHNIAETANYMHIHRNTLVYRLKKIRELIGEDIEDIKRSEELLTLMMMKRFED